MSKDVVAELASTIHARRAESAGKSYTRQLLDGGQERCAKKFGEEAVEAVIAGVSGSDDALKAEAADVVFHLIVLLEARNISWDDVLSVLAARQGVSGHVEKSARPGK
jgi:phosphoribosyl-ATP pyrophosphohydrolase